MTARRPLSETLPTCPSVTTNPITNSQIPSFGVPPNWQLQPCRQLQASTLSALTRYGVRSMGGFYSVSRGGCQRRLMTLSSAQIDDLGWLADFEHVEGIGVVVDVGDRLAANLDDDVAFGEPRLVRGTSSDDAAQKEPLGLGRVIGNGACEDTDTAAAHRRDLLFDLRVRGHRFSIFNPADDRRRKLDYAVEIRVVNLVSGIGWPVIVGVHAGEERHAGNSCRGERHHIGRLIGIVL